MRRTLAAAAALALLVPLAACSSSDSTSGDPAACKSAMEKQLSDAIATGATGTRPPECAGVSDAELQRIATEILGGAASS